MIIARERFPSLRRPHPSLKPLRLQARLNCQRGKAIEDLSDYYDSKVFAHAEANADMIRCYHCGTDNLDGSEYCDECGTKLNAASSARSAYAPPQSFSSPISSEM